MVEATKKVKAVKPPKLVFTPVNAVFTHKAARVKEIFESIAEYLEYELFESFGGSPDDWTFLRTSQVLLDLVIEKLSKGVDQTEFIEPWAAIDVDLLCKVFAKEIKAVKTKTDLELGAKNLALARMAELDKTHSSPVRLKKADIAKATVLLSQAGIELISA